MGTAIVINDFNFYVWQMLLFQGTLLIYLSSHIFVCANRLCTLFKGTFILSLDLEAETILAILQVTVSDYFLSLF